MLQFRAGCQLQHSEVRRLSRVLTDAANLTPRKMKFGLSEGMVLAASDTAGETAGIFLLSPDAGA